MTLLRVEIDNELNFYNHISNICKKAGNKINAISRIQSFLGQKEKKALVNTFLYSNFNYCSLVWHFSTKKSTNKVEKIKSIAYKITLFSIITTLLKHRWSTCKSLQSSMEIKHLRTLAMEIFKTLNDINLNYMKEIFYLSPSLMKHKKYDLFVHCLNRTKYGNHLRVLKPHVWNSLPEEIKQLSSLNAFKNYLKVGMAQKQVLLLLRIS